MSPRSHPFDAYAAFTDVAALKEASARMLRKSVRVNTLKCPVETFLAHARERGWQLQPVPWCPQAFFVDREDRSTALGRDLLHLLGHFYMQEAASMLPAELLDPRPGEVVLDMSAAPGSKTTQIAARMGGRGVIVANDVQEKRLWTLKHACQRLGVVNLLVVKKVGQWYAKHMTERFDRVLCDAPCTAQGTARKDSDALLYSSDENTVRMSRLQRDLLEAAVHAAAVGGRIVYSTCTLTPEENEGTIVSIMNKFGDQLEVVDPRRALGDATWCDQALEDSARVQDVMRRDGAPIPEGGFPLLRFWPHTYDTEGFFCAILRKRATTRHPEPMERVAFQETLLPKGRARRFAQTLLETYGAPFLREDEELFERGPELLLTTEEVGRFELPVQDYAIGLPFARRLDDENVRLNQELVSLRGGEATRGTVELTDDELQKVLAGADLENRADYFGDVILRHRGIALGTGLAQAQVVRNRLSRWLVQRS